MPSIKFLQKKKKKNQSIRLPYKNTYTPRTCCNSRERSPHCCLIYALTSTFTFGCFADNLSPICTAFVKYEQVKNPSYSIY